MQKSTAHRIAVTLFTLLVLYGKSAAAQGIPSTGAEVKTLATVNGVPITEYDVPQNMKRPKHGKEVSNTADKTILETVVRNEIIYQAALELGLDNNPAYQKKIKEAEAQLRSLKRERMAPLYSQYIKSRVSVTDSDALAYFEKNAERIRTTFHIWQILYKGEDDKIAKDESDLKAGMPFEEVASRRFPELPKLAKLPWDLGVIHWNQIPKAWTSVIYDLESGKPSPILKGENGRLWIIEIVTKKIDEEITFATEKDRIVEILKSQKNAELFEDILNRKRVTSSIVFQE